MCCNRDYGCLLATVISIFIGIIVGVLFFFGFITTSVPVIWIAFGLGVLSLIGLVTLSVSETTIDNKCICLYGRCLLLGIFGTIISSIVALAFVLAAGAVIASLVLAVLAFFLSLLLMALIMAIRCLIEANCGFRE